MSYLFISHSSQNDFHAIALKNWLIAQGWDEIFLDLDPERGIVAAERWERALHDAAGRCKTKHWYTKAKQRLGVLKQTMEVAING